MYMNSYSQPQNKLCINSIPLIYILSMSNMVGYLIESQKWKDRKKLKNRKENGWSSNRQFCPKILNLLALR